MWRVGVFLNCTLLGLTVFAAFMSRRAALFALLRVRVGVRGVCWPLAEAPWLLGGRGHRQSPWPCAPGWRLPSAGVSVTDAGSQRPLRHTSDKQQMLKGFVFPPGGAARALVYCGRRGLGLTDQWCPGPRLAGAWERRPALLLQTLQHGVPRGCAHPLAVGGRHPTRPAQWTPRRPALGLSQAPSGMPGGADRPGRGNGDSSGQRRCFLEVQPAAPRRVPQPVSELYRPQECLGPFSRRCW